MLCIDEKKLTEHFGSTREKHIFFFFQQYLCFKKNVYLLRDWK